MEGLRYLMIESLFREIFHTCDKTNDVDMYAYNYISTLYSTFKTYDLDDAIVFVLGIENHLREQVFRLRKYYLSFPISEENQDLRYVQRCYDLIMTIGNYIRDNGGMY